MNSISPIESQVILLAEDDANDVMLIQRAFRKTSFATPLQVVKDGTEVIDYLSGVGEYANRELHPLPFLMLLDLKMPVLDGFGVLTWVRNNPLTRRLLVVVLSSSDCQTDVDRAYELGANSYLLKPLRFEEMAGMVQRFVVYWREINRFPSTANQPRIPLTQSAAG